MKTPRKGVSLIEALMAIFVTAIGLLSLLVLFPVGAFRMAQAITDDRSAHLATNAFALVQAHNFRDDQVNENAIFMGFQNGAPTSPALTTLDGPSYPVYVDPTRILPTSPASTIGTTAAPLTATPGILRLSVQSFGIATFGDARRWFALPDDLTYSSDGAFAGLSTDPNQTPALTPGRDGSYTAAYMLRRPKASVPSIVETTVVVYKNRPSIGGENAYVLNPGQQPFDINSNEVQIPWAPGMQETPPVRKGSWILDATVLNAAGQPEPHGFFYRVVNVTDNGAGSMIVELATKPKMSTVGNGNGVLVVMENVVEVFEKGAGWRP
jgi:hypothetical protein